MWWRRLGAAGRRARVLGSVLALAALTAGCFQPLYSKRPGIGSEGIGDKLAAVQIPPIAAPKGSPVQRLAVATRNALQYDLNGGAGASAPTHRLDVNLGTTQWTVVIDPASGRPDAQIDTVIATYQLVEIATGRVVLTDTIYAHVDYDVPGVEQRFAEQRAQRDAEDRAVQVVAETIKNRLASYFVAGT